MKIWLNNMDGYLSFLKEILFGKKTKSNSQESNFAPLSSSSAAAARLSRRQLLLCHSQTIPFKWTNRTNHVLICSFLSSSHSRMNHEPRNENKMNHEQTNLPSSHSCEQINKRRACVCVQHTHTKIPKKKNVSAWLANKLHLYLTTLSWGLFSTERFGGTNLFSELNLWIWLFQTNSF